jgi:hypothetical protein
MAKKRAKSESEPVVDDLPLETTELELEESTGDRSEVAEALTIDPVNIKQEFVKLPGQFAYYGEQAAHAAFEATRAKTAAKKTYARVYLALKAESEHVSTNEGGRRFSEAQLNALVEVHPEMQLAYSRQQEAELRKSLAFSTLEAFRAKRDSLVSITGHVRDERRAMGMSGAADDEDDV